jgi:predicted dienelactone hydrolase
MRYLLGAMTRRLLALVLLAGALAAGLACGSGGDDGSSEVTLESVTARGEYGVGVTTMELVDTSRPTEAYGTYEGADQRILPTEVWYPAEASVASPEARDAEIDSDGGPYPLIVFSHGFTSSRRQSVTYTQHLASHGYVVVAPDFPVTNGGAPDGPYFLGVVNQPGDVSFLIDQFLAFNEEPGNQFEGAIDPEMIGATGHSMGAFTTETVVWGQARDERVDAGLAISGTGCFLNPEDIGDTSVPMMLLTGSNDLIVPAPGNRVAYDMANPPRYWVQIGGANHIRFADVDLDDAIGVAALESVGIGPGGEEEPVLDAVQQDIEPCDRRGTAPDQPLTLERQQELLRAFATPFFDGYLRGDEDSLAFLQNDLPALAPEASFEFELP